MLGIASDFVVSAEFKTLYGDSPAKLMLINAFYNNMLHRDGEKDRREGEHMALWMR